MTARFLALYETPADPEAFDQHYWEVHIPLGRRLPGLRRCTLGRETVAVRGGGRTTWSPC
ncbi:EthD family reductase [Streptomyces sp. CoH27]|uniref:EthD family reductase n=1 Tax=Streptomyces sp. CoH27 TaxID=2875763 RepID=UPI001CD66DD0|nr:EthD family reductase [Streptomyces sp. CoH27]